MSFPSVNVFHSFNDGRKDDAVPGRISEYFDSNVGCELVDCNT
jgi:hypothetical protein